MKLQIAFDLTDLNRALQLAEQVWDFADILEVGTPLIKSAGIKAVEAFRKRFEGRLILADLKTMDTGALEARMAAEHGAHIATVCAAAAEQTVASFIEEAHRQGISAMLDTIGAGDRPQHLHRLLRYGPDFVLLHRAVDQEESLPDFWGQTPNLQARTAVAGGITPEALPAILPLKPEIIVVGRWILSSKNPAERARLFKNLLSKEQNR